MTTLMPASNTPLAMASLPSKSTCFLGSSFSNTCKLGNRLLSSLMRNAHIL